MIETWAIGDLRTGRLIANVDPAGGSKVANSITGDSVDLELALSGESALRLIEAVEPWRHFVAVLHDGVPAVACPIVTPITWDGGSADRTPSLTISGSDFRRSWASRRVVVDPAKAGSDYALESALTFSGSWPSIVDAILLRLHRADWVRPPLILPGTWGAGSHTVTVEQSDLKRLSEVLDEIESDQAGAEVRFVPVMQTSNQLAWRVDVGTAAAPYVAGTGTVIWDARVEQSPATITSVTKDGGLMTRRNFVAGGRADDRVIITEQRAAVLADGEVLIETVDSSHSDESDRAKLNAAGWDRLNLNALPLYRVGLRVLADGPPPMSIYKAGDWCELIVANVPLLRDGRYRSRILSRSWSAGAPTVDVEIAPPAYVGGA